MSIKVAQKLFYLKMKSFDTFKKLHKDDVYLGKIIVAKGVENLSKVQ